MSTLVKVEAGSVESSDDARRYSVRWPVNITNAHGGVVRGHTFYASTSGLIFHAPIRYRAGDLLDLEIFIGATQSIRCTGRVIAQGTPFHVEFVKFADGDLKIWNDILLTIHRARVNRPDSNAI